MGKSPGESREIKIGSRREGEQRGNMDILPERESIDPTRLRGTLLTPLSSLEKIDSIQLGDVVLDPRTFFDQPVRARG
jgi:hypothetical protein